MSAFILNRLDYCNTVLTNLPVSTIALLQRVQNAAAQLIKGLRPRDHVTSALRDLHWLPVRHRITYKLCVLMHLVHTGTSPSYLSGLVTATVNIPFRKRIRSANTNRYEPLTTHRSPPDSSSANGAFHTPDPKLGMSCLTSFRT